MCLICMCVVVELEERCLPVLHVMWSGDPARDIICELVKLIGNLNTLSLTNWAILQQLASSWITTGSSHTGIWHHQV